MQSRPKRVAGLISGGVVVLALATVGFGMKADGQNSKEPKAALPAEHVIASIRTAVAAKPGNVRAVEVEKNGERAICEVEVLAHDGKTYEVEVDVVTNTIIEVEEGND
jgi:uncharacterized membrane protein YkoI